MLQFQQSPSSKNLKKEFHEEHVENTSGIHKYDN